MASPRVDDHGARGMENFRIYKKEHSVYVDVGDNRAVKAKDVIREVEKLVGMGKLYGCVPKSGNLYVLTFEDKIDTELILDGLQCGGKNFECRPVKVDTMYVSFMNVDLYISDDEIVRKLQEIELEVIGKVRRIHHEESEIENGTRVVKVKLPPNFTSLPYLMRLSDGESSGMYRVIHDNQKKLCHKCHRDDHLFRNCPEFICNRCSKQGHYQRQCSAEWCQPCFKWDCGVDHQIVIELQNQVAEIDDTESESGSESGLDELMDGQCRECLGFGICACVEEITEKPQATPEKEPPENLFGEGIKLVENINTENVGGKSSHTQAEPVTREMNGNNSSNTKSTVRKCSENTLGEGVTQSEYESSAEKPVDIAQSDESLKKPGHSQTTKKTLRSTSRKAEKMETENSTVKRVHSSPEPISNKVKVVETKKKSKKK